MADFAEILERLKEASGPDEQLDLDIARALVPDVVCLRHNRETGGNEPFVHWKYTDSADAAIALVDRVFPGWAKGFDSGPETHIAFVDRHDYKRRFLSATYTAEGKTPALALLTALFKAILNEQPVRKPERERV